MKDIELIKLYDIYKGLLTEKQSELFSSYYCLDLSLSEIAETEGTTRQSVFIAVKKVKQKLLDYESTLKIKSTEDKLSALISEVKDEEIKEKIRRIING